MRFRGESLYGRAATFKLEEFFAGRTQSVVTTAEVYAFGKWVIKFRMTYPTATESAATESISAFKKEFFQENDRDPNIAVERD